MAYRRFLYIGVTHWMNTRGEVLFGLRHRDYYTAMAALLDAPARTDYEERAEHHWMNTRGEVLFGLRHRDYYTAMAALLDAPARTDYEERAEQAEIEMDNLRTAFGWSLENSDIQQALTLASSLQPLWLTRGPILEGLAWFDTVPTDETDDLDVAAPTLARALADRAALATFVGDSMVRPVSHTEIPPRSHGRCQMISVGAPLTWLGGSRERLAAARFGLERCRVAHTWG